MFTLNRSLLFINSEFVRVRCLFVENIEVFVIKIECFFFLKIEVGLYRQLEFFLLLPGL